MITGMLLSFPVGCGFGVFGVRNGWPLWVAAFVALPTAAAVSLICTYAGLP